MQRNLPLLSVKNLSCARNNNVTFSDISFDVNVGDIVVLTGRSGCGKTTLLKCLAHLNLYQGEILLHGRKPTQYGIPRYRTLVLYVPQRPSLLPSTPREFLKLVSSFSSRKVSKAIGDVGEFSEPMQIAGEWGIDGELWDRTWTSLSGGESQRIALAVAVGIGGAEVLLLDEPTSALDAGTSALVERTLLGLVNSEESTVKAIIWITHSDEQYKRVGTRYLSMGSGVCVESTEMGIPKSVIR